MLRREILSVAIDALRANPLRAILTMLGVIIGSTCLVLVVTIALTGKQYILAQIEGIGSNIVYAHLVRTGEIESSTGDEISLDDLRAVQREIPQAARVAGSHSLIEVLVVGGREYTIRLVGITNQFQAIRNLQIVQGRFLDSQDMTSRSKVCVITEELASLLYPAENPIGREVRVGEVLFTVVGVFRERISTFGQSEIQQYSVIIPLTVFKYFLGHEHLYTLYVQADSPSSVEHVTEQVERVLQSRHRPGTVYRAENLKSLLDAADRISFALTLVLLLAALISLIISGVGIMNIMLVTVSQRTKEIGVRKSIGAPRAAILRQFLFEALLISSTGAVIGVLIALFTARAATQFLPTHFSIRISPLSVVVALLVTSLTGIVFGILPARRAADLPPTEALRYE
jgi:putative ABC transport system permease protein